MFNPKLCKTMQLTAICKNASILYYKRTVSLLFSLKARITGSLKRIPTPIGATKSSDKALAYAYNTSTKHALIRFNIVIVLMFAGFTQVSAAGYHVINRKLSTYVI